MDVSGHGGDLDSLACKFAFGQSATLECGAESMLAAIHAPCVLCSTKKQGCGHNKADSENGPVQQNKKSIGRLRTCHRWSRYIIEVCQTGQT